MKKFLIAIAALVFLGLSAFAFADDGCPLFGHTYSLEANGITWELSGFECEVGPGCRGDCDFLYGDFKVGPVWHFPLRFSCQQNGTIIIAGFQCALDARGNLECLAVDVSGYYCAQLGEKTWCFPKEPGVLEFALEE